MASRTTLNATNLEALGAKRLAGLLLDLSTGNAALKLRLRLGLAGAEGSANVAREVRKRLATLARSRSLVDWQKQAALVDDLEAQRWAIVEQVAKDDPAEALSLTSQFLALAPSVLERCDDRRRTVVGTFRLAVANLDAIASATRPDPTRLAEDVAQALTHNDHGQYDNLVDVLALPLGPQGLEHLKRRMVALSSRPVERPPGAERQVIGHGPSGPAHADEVAERSHLSTVRLALMDIADALGDVDAFIAQHDEPTRKVPKVAAGIARRLLAADRAQDAWQAIEAAQPRDSGRSGSWTWPDLDWEDTRIEVLGALGHAEEAQAARWSCFERSLSAEHLRACPKRLPDFEDVEVEEGALAYAQGFKSLLQALSFLVSWPALDHAAALVIRRARELDGDRYEVLTAAAGALAGRYPLAATLALRPMIDFALTCARSSCYRHAARHLLECESLASSVPDQGAVEPHAAYVARLRAQHGRKASFWSLISSQMCLPPDPGACADCDFRSTWHSQAALLRL